MGNCLATFRAESDGSFMINGTKLSREALIQSLERLKAAGESVPQ